MADRAMDVYLNDHLAGATIGRDLAAQIADRQGGEALGRIAKEIDEDRDTLVELMQRLDVSGNPVKQATGWIAEKASRVKFSGALSGEPSHGAFMALEALTLGVAGKACLWTALKQVSGEYPPLAAADLDRLIARAQEQHDALERERVAAGKRALSA